MLILTVFGLLALHSVEIWSYAFLYAGLGEFETLETSLYFSAATFTTLGFGDVTLDVGRRLIAGTEALIGLILIGWSTAILVSLTTRMNDVRYPGRRSGPGEASQPRNSP
ncbi:MAG: two pore domain potassium channel family protein [Rhodospirillaceae bacterium]|nr:two pore domain potassium channel family protein [Rhodospirillaceae bacterium]